MYNEDIRKVNIIIMAQAHEAQLKWHCNHFNNKHISKVNIILLHETQLKWHCKHNNNGT